MKYSAFIEKVVYAVEKKLPDVKLSVQEVTKNNDVKLTGLTMGEEDKNVLPTIYLNDFYNEAVSDSDIEGIVMCIVGIYHENKNNGICINIEGLLDFEKIKDRIYYVLVNTAANKERLSSIPHREMLDLSITYKFDVDVMDDENIGSIAINNEIIKKWGITEEDLFNLAEVNTPRLFEVMCKKMKDVIKDIFLHKISEYSKAVEINEIKDLLDYMTEINDNDDMMVLTNDKKIDGSNIVLNKDVMSDICKSIGHEVYMLPSSIHEWLIINKDVNEMLHPEGLKAMVVEANQNQVAVEEKLSDNVYILGLDGNLRLAEF